MCIMAIRMSGATEPITTTQWLTKDRNKKMIIMVIITFTFAPLHFFRFRFTLRETIKPLRHIFHFPLSLPDQGLFGAAAPAVEDEGQGQGQAWPQEAADAPLEGLFGDENMDNLEGLQEANVEVRLAIFEILGVEGPFHLMFRNSFWLLGFCALYLFFTAMLPFVIGNMLFKLIATYAQPAAFLVPSSVKLMVSLIQSHSTEAVPLQFLDFFFIFGGCCGVFIAVFLMDCLATGLLRLKIPNTLKIVLELINKLAVVIKVGSLLLIRIFLLPLCLGESDPLPALVKCVYVFYP